MWIVRNDIIGLIPKCTSSANYLENQDGRLRRLKRKKLAASHRVVFQVAFSLLLAFLGGSAVKKVRGMALQYPRRTSPVSKWRHNT